VYNTEGDFSLLSTGKIQVQVYNTHRLLLKSFQWREVACVTSMSLLLPSSRCQYRSRKWSM